MLTLSSLVTTQAVVTTTCGAASDDKVGLISKTHAWCRYWQQNWRRDFSLFSKAIHTPDILREQEPNHDDVIKWKHFPRYWPFVWGIHRSPVNSPQKGQWRGALMFSLVCAWTNGWGNYREAGDLRRHRGAHYDVIVMPAYSPQRWWVIHKSFSWDFIVTNIYVQVHSMIYSHWQQLVWHNGGNGLIKEIRFLTE